MTLSDVAKLLHVDPTTVGQWESGKNLPKRHNFEPLVQLLPELKHSDLPDVRDLPMSEQEEQARVIKALREQLQELGIKPCV